MEVLDFRQCVANTLAIDFHVTRDIATVLNGLLGNVNAIPGQSGHVIRHVTMLAVIAIDEFFGRAFRPGRCVVSTEIQPIAVRTTKVDQFG